MLSFLGLSHGFIACTTSVQRWPRAWTLQVVQVYFQLVIATKDFIYFIYCLTFVTSHLCLKFALIPILCRSLERIAKFLRHNFSRSTLYRWQRNIVQTFMYWQIFTDAGQYVIRFGKADPVLKTGPASMI
ncbi:hypothetical protein ERO13_A03G111050v2 [Gossypium hirsutum]|nr:hypothetical protein ERO13_A03G111050v2 [Gossypium hirsutum]KAG4208111.1 hypothetical protein ERO13_A03G111050v2 [Gossypium hirsutum]KAG4208112.1 hypothetical protein ERO13_A03G111050v2 [Gossypium hirsutum]